MAKTISNVMTGVAVLEVGTPDSRAQWSNEVTRLLHSHSVKLQKIGSGDYGSTGVQFKATGAAAGQKITDFETLSAAWGWYYYRQAVEGAYWMQMELHFEDPLSTSWVDVSTQTMVAPPAGTPAWILETLQVTDLCGLGGWSETDGSFSDWDPKAISLTSATLQGVAPNVTNADDWVLTSVKIEM